MTGSLKTQNVSDGPRANQKRDRNDVCRKSDPFQYYMKELQILSREYHI